MSSFTPILVAKIERGVSYLGVLMTHSLVFMVEKRLPTYGATSTIEDFPAGTSLLGTWALQTDWTMGGDEAFFRDEWDPDYESLDFYPSAEASGYDFMDPTIVPGVGVEQWIRRRYAEGSRKNKRRPDDDSQGGGSAPKPPEPPKSPEEEQEAPDEKRAKSSRGAKPRDLFVSFERT